jgi:hypothetical protein
VTLWLHQYHDDYWTLGHKVTFYPEARLIVVAPEISRVDIKVDVYSAMKEWLQVRDNLKYDPAARAAGGDPVPGGFSGTQTFLINNWRILVDHSVVFVGSAYSDDFDSLFATVPGQQLSRHQFSNLVDSFGLDSDSLRSAVWGATAAANNFASTMGALLNLVPTINTAVQTYTTTAILADGLVQAGSTDSVIQTNITGRGDNFYNRHQILIETSGGDIQGRVIKAYLNTGEIQLVRPLSFVPAAGLPIRVLGQIDDADLLQRAIKPLYSLL